MRAAALAVLALTGIAAAAIEPHDLTDPAGDVEAIGPGGQRFPAQRPSLDVLRVSSRVVGAEVVQVATLAAPLDGNATLTFHNQAGPTEAHAIAIDYVKGLAEGERVLARITRPGEPVRALAANASEEGANVTVRFALADIPAWAACLEPAVVAGAVLDGITYSDVLQHGHDRASCGGARSPDAGALAVVVIAGVAAMAWRRR